MKEKEVIVLLAVVALALVAMMLLYEADKKRLVYKCAESTSKPLECSAALGGL